MEFNFNVNIIFSYIIVFCRVGSVFMLLPGIAESFAPMRVRVLLSLFISLILVPHIILPDAPKNIMNLILMIINEIIIGIFIGLITKFLVSAMHTLGIIIATISGLGSAMLFDPTQGTQGAIVGNFLNNLAIILLFHSDIDHLLIQFIANSYSIFHISQKIEIDFMTTEIVSLISDVFDIAIKLALPQIIIALTMMIAGGVLGRLMPSLQIFNLFTPIQMIISFVILMVTLSSSMNWYINNIYDLMKEYLFR